MSPLTSKINTWIAACVEKMLKPPQNTHVNKDDKQKNAIKCLKMLYPVHLNCTYLVIKMYTVEHNVYISQSNVHVTSTSCQSANNLQVTCTKYLTHSTVTATQNSDNEDTEKVAVMIKM